MVSGVEVGPFRGAIGWRRLEYYLVAKGLQLGSFVKVDLRIAWFSTIQLVPATHPRVSENLTSSHWQTVRG